MGLTVLGKNGFLNHIERVASSAKKVDADIALGVAAAAKTALLAEVKTEIPGGHLARFSDGKGITLSASYKVTAAGGTAAEVTLLPIPPGPWYLLEGGSPAHQIGVRVKGRGKRGLRNQGGFLGRPGVFAANGPVSHPGMRGKGTWDHAATAGATAGEKAFGTVGRATYVKLFTG